MNIEKSKALALLSVVVVIAAISGIILNAASAQTTVTTQTAVTNEMSEMPEVSSSGCMIRNVSMGILGLPHGIMRERMFRGFIIVSDEFKEKVISIAKNDADVQNLLNEGYNVTRVKPIIKTMVEGDGTVTMKATGAVITLQKNTSGRAYVWVDLEQGKVTRIEIITRTAIEKS